MNTRTNSIFQKFFLFLMALVIMAPLAMAFPAFAKSNVPASGMYRAIPVCRVNCVRVTDIFLTKASPFAESIRPEQVVAVVTISQTPSIGLNDLRGFQIEARWQFPDGSREDVVVSGVTNRYGKVTFVTDAQEGEITFTILNVVKKNYTFDRYNSILTKSIK